MSRFILPDMDSGCGYPVKHTMITAPAKVAQIHRLNQPTKLLGPNVIDPSNPPKKEKKERVYKPCEKLLIRLKKECAKD